jgi:hypothetical protein
MEAQDGCGKGFIGTFAPEIRRGKDKPARRTLQFIKESKKKPIKLQISNIVV